jgi:hypothetical protein
LYVERKSYEIYSVQVDDKVKEEFRSRYLELLEKEIDTSEEYYSPSNIEENSILIYETNKIYDIDRILETRSAGKLDFKRQYDFTYMRFGNNKMQELYVFRLYPHSKFLNKSKLKSLWITDDVLEFSKKDTLVIDTSIDCVVFDQKIAIVNLKNFEKIYDLRQYYLKQSNEVFRYFKSNTDYQIANIEKLKTACEKNYTLLRKMSSIQQMKIYSSLTLARIKQFNKQKNLDIKIENNQIEFPTIYKFINLYNDDNLMSELTRNNYLSSNKKRIL